jgi:hypothetical protein
VVQAAERLAQIQERMPDVAREWRGHPIARAQKSTPGQLELSLQDWNWHQLPSARMLTMLASESLHHARIALDYIAYHAVWLDGGKARDGTKFPLVTDASKWGKEKRSSLPGITEQHAAWIREIQPFEGVGWSADLVQLSNRDKHRMAVEVVPTYRCQVDYSRLYPDPLGDAGYNGYAVHDARLELNIAPAMAEGESTVKPLPLDETLAKIVAGVCTLTNRFLVQAGYQPISLTWGPEEAPVHHAAQ